MSGLKHILLANLVGVFALACGIQSAQAQVNVAGSLQSGGYSNFARDRGTSVRERRRPGYEALGFRAGSFLIWPKLSGVIETNDNVYASSNNPESATVRRFAPELTISSDWTRHALQAYARGVINQYLGLPSENTNDYDLGLQLQLDVLRKARINANTEWAILSEPRTSAPSQGLSAPVQYELTTAVLSGEREFNRLRTSARLDLRQYDYLNRQGNPQQHDRDRFTSLLLGRVDYAVSPNSAIFFQVSGNRREYRLKSSPIVQTGAGPVAVYPGFQDRDSQGIEVLSGANFQLSGLSRGEIGLGYLRQDYRDTRFGSITGLGARAQVEWFPTQLTSVTFSILRNINDAGIAGAAGYVATDIGVQIDHELLRNLILGAQLSYGLDGYRAADRTDRRMTLGLTASYLLNRHLGVTFGYNHFDQQSRGAAGAGDFKVNKVSATLTMQK